MDTLLAYFEQMPDWQRFTWVVICLGLSWVMEGLFPLVRMSYRKWRHAGVNATFLVANIAVSLLVGAATIAATSWTAGREFGLLHLFELNVWWELVIALVVLDLTAQYWAHYLLHHVRWLWRFHVVHHSDTKVDATTGVRLHPVDYAVREVFALGALLITGAPLAFYVVYRLVTVFFTFVAHANVAPPPRIDNAAQAVFVTPNMHKFHHHVERPWTDSNFGGVLSIWDRMFGTYVSGDPRQVVYGVDVADPTRDEDVLHQLALPFERGRSLDR